MGVDDALLGVNDALGMHHLVWLDPGVDDGWKSLVGMTQLIAGTKGEREGEEDASSRWVGG